jgi:3',5'-cyclic AMP phosphodiesterase CpdA
METVAHLSDLHLGKDPQTDAAARRLCAALIEQGVALTLVTGDITHRGRASELRTFEATFAPLLGAGRLIVVPGNHDRLGDDAGRSMMMCGSGGHVDVRSRPGLHIVRFDSTAPHNRSLIEAHGRLEERDVEAIVAAMEAAPAGALTVLLLHHHLLPLPPELFGERLSALLGWPNAAELELGARLLERLRGRCDLVLHGHRHAPSEMELGSGSARPLRVWNAGSSTELAAFRALRHAGGKLVSHGWRTLGSAPLHQRAVIGAAA